MTLTPTTATPASSLSFMSSLLRLSPLSPRAHQALSLAATFLRSRHVFVKATVCGCAEGSYYINIKRATYGSYILPVCHQAQSSLSLHPGTKFQVMRNASVYPSPKDPQWRMLLGYRRRACHRQVNISPSGPDVLLLGDVLCSTNCLLLVYLWLSPSFFLSVIFIQILLLSALSKKRNNAYPRKRRKPISETKDLEIISFYFFFVWLLQWPKRCFLVFVREISAVSSVHVQWYQEEQSEEQQQRKGHQRRTLPEPFSLEQIP